jgi:hypothetical protein
VTSINAGMAVPDWPTSFQSYDPFNPWPEWWTITPVLAEHGHRFLGMLVGFMTVGPSSLDVACRPQALDANPRLCGSWTGHRIQGVLGGLRVVYVSLNLAMVHAAFAQIFFAMSDGDDTLRLPKLAAGSGRTHTIGCDASGGLRTWSFDRRCHCYICRSCTRRICLRHPGTGLDPLLAIDAHHQAPLFSLIRDRICILEDSTRTTDSEYLLPESRCMARRRRPVPDRTRLHGVLCHSGRTGQSSSRATSRS